MSTLTIDRTAGFDPKKTLVLTMVFLLIAALAAAVVAVSPGVTKVPGIFAAVAFILLALREFGPKDAKSFRLYRRA